MRRELEDNSRTRFGNSEKFVQVPPCALRRQVLRRDECVDETSPSGSVVEKRQIVYVIGEILDARSYRRRVNDRRDPVAVRLPVDRP